MTSRLGAGVEASSRQNVRQSTSVVCRRESQFFNTRDAFVRGLGHQQLKPAYTQRCPARKLCARRKDSPLVSPVIPIGKGGEEAMDLYTYLLQNRIIFIGSFIDFEVATQVVGSLLALEAMDEKEDIKIYINSLGGSIYAVLGILDVMLTIKPNISTVVFGMSGGNASLILAGGSPGKRFAMPNSRILLQQPAGYLMGSAEECNITATELNRALKIVNQFYSKFTGMTVEEMEQETNRENFLSAKIAVDLKIVDGIV